MSHSPAHVVSRLLVALGLGSDPALGNAWPVYAGGEPGEPDECLTLYDTAGVSDGRSLVTGELMTHDGFQVRIRSRDHPRGWAKADAIRTALAEQVYQRVVAIDGAVYLVYCVARIGNVIALGKEVPASKRSIFTLNALAAIEEL